MSLSPLSVASLGPPMQLGYVVQDLSRSLDFWTTRMGVGPFFRMDRVPFTGARYLGRECLPDISTAFAYWGSMQIELIQQNDTTPSIFKPWIDNGGAGVHHVCVKVPNLEIVRAQCDAQRCEIVQEAWMDGAGRFIYADLAGGQGLIEFAQLEPSFDDLFDYMRRAASGWSGDQPVRAIPSPEVWSR